MALLGRPGTRRPGKAILRLCGAAKLSDEGASKAAGKAGPMTPAQGQHFDLIAHAANAIDRLDQHRRKVFQILRRHSAADRHFASVAIAAQPTQRQERAGLQAGLRRFLRLLPHTRRRRSLVLLYRLPAPHLQIDQSTCHGIRTVGNQKAKHIALLARL
jgi:hypothetical protein